MSVSGTKQEAEGIRASLIAQGEATGRIMPDRYQRGKWIIFLGDVP